MSPTLIRVSAAISTGVIAYLCGAYYANMHPLAPQAPVFGAFVGFLWCWIIYPRLGKVVMRDIYMISLTPLVVGAVGGTFYIPFMGTYEGFAAALLLPFKSPWPIAFLYLIGIAMVFVAPRLRDGVRVGPLQATE